MSTIKVTAVNANIGASTITIAPGGGTGPTGPKGDTGDQGPAGPAGEGVAAGGTAGQALVKIDGADYNTEWADVASTADAVSVTDAGGYFTGTDVEAVLQEIGATPGLEGWEIAQLTEGTGGTIWEDNKTELQRAYATGKPVWLPPGTYEVDDLLIPQTQTDFIIKGNITTLLRPSDPGIVSRDTDSMIRVEGGHRNVFLLGEITVDANEGLAYDSDATTFYILNDNVGERGDLIIEDITIKNAQNIGFTVDRTNIAPAFVKGHIGFVKMIDSHKRKGFTIRTIFEQGLEVNSLYSIETGGDKGNRWGSILYTNVRTMFSFELGEASIIGSYSEYIKVNKVHCKFPKYSAFSAIGIFTRDIGDVLVEDAFWNEDGTDATLANDGASGAVVFMKISNYNVIDPRQRGNYRSIIFRGSNNQKELPVVGGGTKWNEMTAIQFPEDSSRYNIEHLEIDCPAILHTTGENTGDETRPGRINNLIYYGGAPTFANQLEISGKVVIDNFILSDQATDSGFSKQRNVIIKDEVRINSLKSIDNCVSYVDFVATSLRVKSDGGTLGTRTKGWWHRSDIQIYNADFGENSRIQFGPMDATAPTAWNPTTSAEQGAVYFKASFINCRIIGISHYFRADGFFVTDFSLFRDRFQLNFYNCFIKDFSTRGIKSIWTNPTTGLLRTNAPSEGTITLVDDLTGGIALQSGAKDLPDGETIGPSIFVNTLWLENSDVYSDPTDFVVQIDSSGFTTNLTAGAVENLQDLAEAVDGLSTGGDLVDDLTPQLGGNLDCNGNEITGIINTTMAGGLLLTDNLFPRFQPANAGSLCVAIGLRALNDVNGAANCVAVGGDALANVTTGSNNVGIGLQAGNSLTTSGSNLAIGTGALQNHVNGGNSNVALGFGALQNLTTGQHNIAIGYQAGLWDSTNANLTSATQNIFIGFKAFPKTNASSTNETVIGYTALGNGSNTVTLGNDAVTDLYAAEDAGATVHAGKFQLSALNTAPSSASDTGTAGEIRVTATHIYVCTATNTWVRAALATW